MTKKEQEDILKSALKRVAMVRDWCGISALPNVKDDMGKCVKEISSVIYAIQGEQK